MVWHLWQENKLDNGLTPATKQQLIRLLHYQMSINQQTFSVLATIDRAVASFQNALMSKDADLLKLPEILPLEEHRYE